MKYKIILSDTSDEILEERIVDSLLDVYYFMKEHTGIYNEQNIKWIIKSIKERND